MRRRTTAYFDMMLARGLITGALIPIYGPPCIWEAFMFITRRVLPLVALFALATALVLVSADANARAGGGAGLGSRGSRTYSTPPATQTAPNRASPIERSMT